MDRAVNELVPYAECRRDPRLRDRRSGLSSESCDARPPPSTKIPAAPDRHEPATQVLDPARAADAVPCRPVTPRLPEAHPRLRSAITRPFGASLGHRHSPRNRPEFIHEGRTGTDRGLRHLLALAAERQAVYFRRLTDPFGPWTDDPILSEYRFTNAYRVTDRVSQYLVRHVQYDPARSQTPVEVFFRTLLFKLFNRIETWEAIEGDLGPISSQSTPLDRISDVLDRQISHGARVYSAAYIMPSPAFGHLRKHANHLTLRTG